MLKPIRRWYNGTPKTTVIENDPNSMVFFGPIFSTEYHWTARLARALVAFYLKHWQWIWTTVIAVSALFVAVLALKRGSA